MMTKQQQVRSFIERKAQAAIAEIVFGDPDLEGPLRKYRGFICGQIAYEATREYSFIELADIMEWKRTRVRR